MTKEMFHFIGIGGIGMSALARILLNEKKAVCGSDTAVNEIVRELIDMGAEIYQGHIKEQLKEGSTVVVSSGIKENNPELLEAKRRGMPVLHRSELLWQLARRHRVLAVGGTHGKTTVSSLLSFVLMHAGVDPSFAIGGILPQLANGRRGSGEFFVLEADESDGSLLNYHPFGAIITNVEAEHMEYFKTYDNLKEVFKQFGSQVLSKDHFLVSKDDPLLSELFPHALSYGFHKEADFRIENFVQKDFSLSFDLVSAACRYDRLQVPLMGEHNAQNSAAVVALALQCGISEDKIREALALFPKVARRAEKKGQVQGIELFDDYAHHPTEVRKTLLGFSRGSQKRLVAIFQPHRYSRLQYHMAEFASCFEAADELIITDIYSASETPIVGVSSEQLVAKVRAKSNISCTYIPTLNGFSHLVEYLTATLRPHDLVVTLGAGSITQLHQPLLKALYERQVKKYRIGLVFGGKSCEHEISLRSARFVNSALDREIYEVLYFGIDKSGGWVVGQEAQEFLANATEIKANVGKSPFSTAVAEEIDKVDIFFPILHGTCGEDGTIQGFFEMIGRPYAGPDFTSAALTMDKVLTKRLIMASGVLTPAFETFSYKQWLKNSQMWLQTIVSSLRSPWIVKPRHLGSSIGVSLAHNEKELMHAIEEAFRFDHSCLVEEVKENCRELEFPVLGSLSAGIEVANPGEKLAFGQVVDYSMKYSLSPVKTEVKPTLAPELLAEGKRLAARAYAAVEGQGMARVDALLDRENRFWFFEINAIPGMTPLSLFPKVWAQEGVDHKMLINRLIISALASWRSCMRHRKTL